MKNRQDNIKVMSTTRVSFMYKSRWKQPSGLSTKQIPKQTKKRRKHQKKRSFCSGIACCFCAVSFAFLCFRTAHLIASFSASFFHFGLWRIWKVFLLDFLRNPYPLYFDKSHFHQLLQFGISRHLSMLFVMSNRPRRT